MSRAFFVKVGSAVTSRLMGSNPGRLALALCTSSRTIRSERAIYFKIASVELDSHLDR